MLIQYKNYLHAYQVDVLVYFRRWESHILGGFWRNMPSTSGGRNYGVVRRVAWFPAIGFLSSPQGQGSHKMTSVAMRRLNPQNLQDWIKATMMFAFKDSYVLPC